MNEQGQMETAYGWNPAERGALSLGNRSPLASPGGRQQFEQSKHGLPLPAYRPARHPQLASDQTGQMSWRGISETFGDTKVDINSAITMNLRFAGQYFDGESGLHQNYFRDLPAAGWVHTA